MSHTQKFIIISLMVLISFMLMQWGAFAADIKIAVIDSGAKGYVDESVSFSDVKGQEDPIDHGTEISRLIRSQSPSSKIHMLQVSEEKDGIYQPSTEAILKAIQWSIDHRMDIVNLSMVTHYDPRVEKAIVEANERYGIIFVAAAGNRTLSSHFSADDQGLMRKVEKDILPGFPSNSENVISVGAIEQAGQVAAYSGKYCDVYEKGETLGQRGTSFACARVTARVANILRIFPNLTKEEILVHLK